MIGPHNERIAELQHRYTSKQMLQKFQSKVDNPLNQIVQKLKRQFSQYNTAYSQQIINPQITLVDRLLSFDGKLGSILSTLEKQNNLLRKQLTVMESQLSNTVSICQQIISQNTQQKIIIKKKNQDIQKIIQTIAINKSQEINDLQQKISILQQQNGILIRHLEQVKKQHQNYIYKFEDKDNQILSWKRKWQQTKKHLNEAITRQHDVSRKLSLSQHNFYQQTQSLFTLQQNLQNLKFENNQLKNQLLLFKDQNKNINVQGIKIKLEAQYANILTQYKQLKKQRTQLLRECQKLKIEDQKNNQIKNNLQKKSNKAINDLQLTYSLLNQQKQKNASLTATISKLQTKIDQLRQQNSRLQMEVSSTNSYAVTKQKMLHRQIDQLRRQIDEKSKQSEKRLIQIKTKMKSLLDTKQIEIQSLNDTNNQLRKIIDMQRPHH